MDWVFESPHSEKLQASGVSNPGLTQALLVQGSLREVMVVLDLEKDSGMEDEMLVEVEEQVGAEEEM